MKMETRFKKAKTLLLLVSALVFGYQGESQTNRPISAEPVGSAIQDPDDLIVNSNKLNGTYKTTRVTFSNLLVSAASSPTFLTSVNGGISNQTILGQQSRAAHSVSGMLLPKLAYSNMPVRILFIGDSVSTFGIGSPYGETVPGAFTRSLKLHYGNAGRAYPNFPGGTPGAYAYGGRPEGIYMGNAITLYQSDSPFTYYNQPTDYDKVSCSSVTLFWVGTTNGGYITNVLSSTAAGSITNVLQGYSATPTVFKTNWVIAPSTDASLRCIGMVGTNTFLTAEFAVATNAPGVIEYYYSWGGTTMAQMLTPGSNWLASYFTAIQPDLVVWHDKHYYGVDTWGNLSNQLSQILSAAKQASTNVVGVLTFPQYSADVYPKNVGTAFGNSVILAVCNASNYPVVDTFSGWANANANNASGLYYDGQHPNSIGARVWGNHWYRAMGFDAPPFAPTLTNFTGSVSVRTLAAGPQLLTITNGAVASLTNALPTPAGPTFWFDPQVGIGLGTGSNITSWTDKTGTIPLTGSGTKAYYVTNFINSLPVVYVTNNPGLVKNGAQQNWFVDSTNHTDETCFIVTRGPTFGYWQQFFQASDGASSTYAFSCAFNGNIVWNQGSNSLTCTSTSATNWSILRFWRSGNTAQIWKNGLLLTNATFSGSGAPPTGSFTLGFLDNGYLGEGVNWARALDTNECANVEATLADKYGIGLVSLIREDQVINLPNDLGALAPTNGATLFNVNQVSGTNVGKFIGDGSLLTNLPSSGGTVTAFTNATAWASNAVALTVRSATSPATSLVELKTNGLTVAFFGTNGGLNIGGTTDPGPGGIRVTNTIVAVTSGVGFVGDGSGLTNVTAKTKGYLMGAGGSSSTMVANTTYYFGYYNGNNWSAQTTEGKWDLTLPETGTIIGYSATVNGSGGDTVACTLALDYNSGTYFGTNSFQPTSFPKRLVVSGLNQAVTATNGISLKLNTPPAFTAPTACTVSFTIVYTVP